jgi:hypothetical protein
VGLVVAGSKNYMSRLRPMRNTDGSGDHVLDSAISGTVLKTRRRIYQKLSAAWWRQQGGTDKIFRERHSPNGQSQQ